MSNGHGGSSGGGGLKATTGGAKKVLSFALALFVVMMIAPNVDTLMTTAEALGGTIAGVFNAIGSMLKEIEAAMPSGG